MRRLLISSVFAIAAASGACSSECGSCGGGCAAPRAASPCLVQPCGWPCGPESAASGPCLGGPCAVPVRMTAPADVPTEIPPALPSPPPVASEPAPIPAPSPALDPAAQGSPGPAASTPGPVSVPGPAPEDKKPQHVVEIRGMAFSPETVTVLQGEKVTWVNHDAVDHTVTRESPPWIDLRVPPGEERSFTFTTVSDVAGFEYFCSIHPKVHRGHVVVMPQVQGAAGQPR